MLAEKIMHPEVPLYLTDGGLETTLVFHDGYDLPEFAAFPLLDTAEGQARLKAYYESYIHIARQAGVGFVLETPTWRASKKWGRLLGYADTDVYRANVMSVQLMQALRERYATATTPMLISGCIGPQDDGYSPQQQLSVAAAETYHRHQVMAFKAAQADLVTAITMTYPEEAIGITNAAADCGLPAVISFTVETDGRLPVEVTLREAIEQVDSQAKVPPAYYMINCAHPDHFQLDKDADWLQRIGGVRANASRLSHAELDASETLDDGNPQEFGALNLALKERLPNLRVIGGCCGTDHRHVCAVAHHCL
ncbi:MAG: homocysteine S-methyltransferase family protein [Pseudomonadota bacterium]